MENYLDFLNPNDFKIITLDHLGLIAGIIDEVGLIDKVDRILPVSKENGAKVTMGQRVAALIINGFGFINNRLYMFPKFLENKPVTRLFGEGVTYEDFNDDALGRCLDAIYEEGPTKLFSALAFQIGLENDLIGKGLHIDTTTISLEGEYGEDEDEVIDINEGFNLKTENEKSTTEDKQSKEQEYFIAPEVPKRAIPKRGYSKDHRPDLKQMVLNLVTTGAAGFPLWAEAHSGNASDKKILYEGAHRMKQFAETMQNANLDYSDFLVIGDSALYESCINNTSNIFWLTRVPESHKETRKYLEQKEEEITWTQLEDGYKVHVFDTHYKNIQQRWCVVFSEEGNKREIKTLEKTLKKQYKKVDQLLKALMSKVYHCETDAKEAIKVFEKMIKPTYYKMSTYTLEVTEKHKGRGRPKEGAKATRAEYKVIGEVIKNEEKLAIKKRTQGRFIVATNQMNKEKIPDEKILLEYKDQSKVESGFKLLKDQTFQIASVYLKKASRIAALMMVMTLCLMTYALGQYKIRKALVENEDTVPTPTNKEINNPTLKAIFHLFQGIHVGIININGEVKELVSNINGMRARIIQYFGKKAMEIYNVRPIYSG
jgi:transposase